MISVTVEFSNVAAASPQNNVKVVCFTATAGQNNYTVSDVPGLSKLVGKEIGEQIFKTEMDGSDLLTSSVLVSWNDTTFNLLNVTVAGGEKIIIWYY